MDGYFFLTAALTFAFSAGVPDCSTRARAFLAWASSSIGYFRLSGSAKDFVGIAFRAAEESFAMFHLIHRYVSELSQNLLKQERLLVIRMRKTGIPLGPLRKVDWLPL